MKFQHDGREIEAFRTSIPIKGLGFPVPPGHWVVIDGTVTVMPDAQFEAEFGETLKMIRHLYDSQNQTSEPN